MLRKLAAITVITLAPGVAAAHPGIGHVHDAIDGFVHPLGGIDHILAMIAVGVFAAQLGGRALWLVPTAFVATMAAAGVLGMAGIALPYTEIGIALSVIALGAAVAFRIKVPTTIAMAMVALFAIFHGYAHGMEMPETLSGLGYGLGFVAATALLHLVGIVGFVLLTSASKTGQLAVRALGGAAAFAGIALLASAA
ncbi:MAG: HupE/UreJ family protein [Xanthobacteraceae bacterium]